MSLSQKSHLVQQLHPWVWLHLEISLQQVLPATNQTHFLSCLRTSSTHRSALPKRHCGSTEIRAVLLTNEIEVLIFQYVDSNHS